MHNHKDFIRTPIDRILEDVVSASAGIGSGVETYPLCDYVMQSVFLKMTGSQEQKLKCICWELAASDYEYRYEFTKKPLGECSSYDDKKNIYKDLIDQIKKLDPKFNILNQFNKSDIITNTRSKIKTIFDGTNLAIWAQHSYNEYLNGTNTILADHFIARLNQNTDETKLFENPLKNKYQILYKHRNRCAHNTLSYQQNLPTLKTLMQEDYRYENYFIYFAILMILDTIFVGLFEKHLNLQMEN